mmetsp:Transcript_32047/g.77471  ORF Transcript_32047/g.77471 Transcript_32047/m.77471 type:complete len:229 (-) Transcript_32047:409-1095(-)
MPTEPPWLRLRCRMMWALRTTARAWIVSPTRSRARTISYTRSQAQIVSPTHSLIRIVSQVPNKDSDCFSVPGKSSSQRKEQPPRRSSSSSFSSKSRSSHADRALSLPFLSSAARCRRSTSRPRRSRRTPQGPAPSDHTSPIVCVNLLTLLPKRRSRLPSSFVSSKDCIVSSMLFLKLRSRLPSSFKPLMRMPPPSTLLSGMGSSSSSLSTATRRNSRSASRWQCTHRS